MEVARAAATAPPPPHAPARTRSSVWMAWYAHYIKGYAAGLPILREALHAFSAGMSVDEELRLALGRAASWPDTYGMITGGCALGARHVQLAPQCRGA